MEALFACSPFGFARGVCTWGGVVRMGRAFHPLRCINMYYIVVTCYPPPPPPTHPPALHDFFPCLALRLHLAGVGPAVPPYCGYDSHEGMIVLRGVNIFLTSSLSRARVYVLVPIGLDKGPSLFPPALARPSSRPPFPSFGCDQRSLRDPHRVILLTSMPLLAPM